MLAVYNSAGEEVRHLYQGRVYADPLHVSLSASAVIAGNIPLTLFLSGPLEEGGDRLFWNGTNDQGQNMSNGLYYLKAQATDPFGRVTTLVMEVLVMNPRKAFLEICNSAGEVVRHMDAPLGSYGTTSGTPNKLVLDKPAFVVDGNGSADSKIHFDHCLITDRTDKFIPPRMTCGLGST